MREPQVDVGPGCGRTFSTRVNCEMYDDDFDLANQSLICYDQYRGDHICTSKDLDILSCNKEFNCEFYHKLGKDTLDYGVGIAQGTLETTVSGYVGVQCGQNFVLQLTDICKQASRNLANSALGTVQTAGNCASNITKSAFQGYQASNQDGFECLSTAIALEGARGVAKGRAPVNRAPTLAETGKTISKNLNSGKSRVAIKKPNKIAHGSVLEELDLVGKPHF